MRTSNLIAGVATAALAFVSCSDETGSLGTTLSPKGDSIKVETKTFSVATRSILADSVITRNANGYIGRIKDPETGAYVTNDFMAQFHGLENDIFPEMAAIVSTDSEGKPIADSCEIRLVSDSQYGDKNSLMSLTAYEMSKPAEEGQHYYSDFDPIELGMVRLGEGIVKNKVYSIGRREYNDVTTSSDTYNDNIRIILDEPYTDKNGNEYNNYGTYIMRQYISHPEYFKSIYNFVHNVCPGFYFKTDGGLGIMTRLYAASINVFFRYNVGDTISNVYQPFFSTEEALQITHVNNDREAIRRLADDPTCTYLKTPAGIFTELTLPIDSITEGHASDSITSAKIVLTRINSSKQREYNLPIPQNLLVLEKDSLDSFFKKKKVADSRTSAVVNYSSSNNTYNLNNLSAIITHLRDAKSRGTAANPNWEKEHPNWNKLLLVPVSVTKTTTTTSSTITKITHDMALSSTRLVGGSANTHDPVKITIIYSKFGK